MSHSVLPPGPAPGEAASGLEIRLFGPMEVRIGSQPLPRLRSRKGLWLLALLVLRAGRPVERDWLAGTLWADGDGAHARRSLRQSLHDLRLALGSEAWRLTDEALRTLRLDLDGASIDVLAFDTALARGDLDSLETAVQLYRGPLLEGCVEEWCLEERRRREQSYVTALERLAFAARARGEPASAVSFLRRAVGADPYQEELQRALMKALAESGNAAGALLVYRQFRALLRREMAAEPSEETTALFRHLRDETRPFQGVDRTGPGLVNDPPVRNPTPRPPTAEPAFSPAPRRPPLPLTALIGRDEAIQEVISRLAEVRLVTLTGTGGVGKTRLALQVAMELLDECADGAAFVDLAPLADPGMVPEAVRAALGVPPGDVRRETIEALRQVLFPRRLLLVLDNCEHLLDACAALAGALLCHCPGLRILATSRQALGLRGETVWRVPSLALPPRAESHCLRAASAGIREGRLSPVSTLVQYPAVRLFVERARAAEASFEMTPHNAPAIVRICRRLDGIPLAIELAAARVGSLSVEEIDLRLRNGFGLLTGGGPALLPRQQTMAAAIDWSWDLLSPAEQALLCRLSVFAGGWTLEAVESVCSGVQALRRSAVQPFSRSAVQALTVQSDPTDPTRAPERLNAERLNAERLNANDVMDLQTSLVDRSLVLYRPAEPTGQLPMGTTGDVRYHLLEPVRQYAADRLRQIPGGGGCEEWEALQNRHRDFFLEWAESVKPKLRGPEQSLWFGRLEAEHDNLRAALEWCRSQGDIEEELRLVVALGRFWDTCGHLREGRAHLDAALTRMTPDLPHPLRVAALVHAGWMAYVQGDYHTARRCYGQALTIARTHGDTKSTAEALNHLALVAFEEDDFTAARALFEEALALCRVLGRSSRLGSVLNNLGSLALRQADYEAARSYLEESASWCESAGDRQLLALVLHDLSVVDFRQARYEEAGTHCAASLRLLHECAAVVDVPMALDQMAVVAQAHAQWERAARLLGAAAGLREAAGLAPHAAPQRADAHAAARCALGPGPFATAFAAGKGMDLEQAFDYALREVTEPIEATGHACPASSSHL